LKGVLQNMTESTYESTGGTGSESSNAWNPDEDVRKAFAGLPLDQKVSTLIQVELDMLGDAVSNVVSAVSKAVNEVAKACESSERPSTAAPGGGGQAPTS
jgi:hypothetical protein